MKIKALLFSLVTVLTLAVSAPAFALGTIGVAVEATDVGGGNWAGMPGIQGSFQIPTTPLSARLGYFTLSGTANSGGGTANYQFNNLVYSITYDFNLPFATLYLGIGGDSLTGTVNGTFGGFTQAGNVSGSSFHYRAGVEFSFFPLIAIDADYRNVSNLFGNNTSNSIYTLGLVLKI